MNVMKRVGNSCFEQYMRQTPRAVWVTGPSRHIAQCVRVNVQTFQGGAHTLIYAAAAEHTAHGFSFCQKQASHNPLHHIIIGSIYQIVLCIKYVYQLLNDMPFSIVVTLFGSAISR